MADSSKSDRNVTGDSQVTNRNASEDIANTPGYVGALRSGRDRYHIVASKPRTESETKDSDVYSGPIDSSEILSERNIPLYRQIDLDMFQKLGLPIGFGRLPPEAMRHVVRQVGEKVHAQMGSRKEGSFDLSRILYPNHSDPYGRHFNQPPMRTRSLGDSRQIPNRDVDEFIVRLPQRERETWDSSMDIHMPRKYIMPRRYFYPDSDDTMELLNQPLDLDSEGDTPPITVNMIGLDGRRQPPEPNPPPNRKPVQSHVS